VRLAGKFMSFLLVGVIGLLVLQGLMEIRRQIRYFNSDMRHDARLLGHALEGLVADVWRSRGEDRALELIRDANRDERLFQIRWVWLDAPPGDSHGPRVPVEELASLAPGRDVVLKRDEEGEEGRLVTYVSVDVGAGRRGALELSESLAVMNDYLRSTRIGMVVLTGTIILLTGILATLLG